MLSVLVPETQIGWELLMQRNLAENNYSLYEVLHYLTYP